MTVAVQPVVGLFVGAAPRLRTRKGFAEPQASHLSRTRQPPQPYVHHASVVVGHSPATLLLVLISGADNRDSEWQSVSLLPADKHTDESESAEALASLEHHLRWRQTSLLVPRQPRASSSACSCIHNPFWVSYTSFALLDRALGSANRARHRDSDCSNRWPGVLHSKSRSNSDEFIQNSGELSVQRSPLRKEFTRGPQPEICPYTIVKNSERQLVYIFHTHVGVKIVGRPDLADWKTKICLIIVPKQVEEKVSGSCSLPL